MSKAFLSHSSVDKPLIEKIATQLGKNNVHYDRLTFEAGHKTLGEIFEGLEDTDVLVFFISEPSLNSDWVKKEISAAHRLNTRNIIDRIFPLIIDKTITYKDPRIPEWLKKPYNIRYFDNEVLILKKIRQFLREVNFRRFSHLQDLNDLFVGRHELLQDFERKLVTIDNSKPTTIIVSSFFDGIGRRTFLRQGLITAGIIDKWYEPIPIYIGAKESIEDFIYQLSFIDAAPDAFKLDLTAETLEAKIEITQKLIVKFVGSNEIIFVIDDGSIVLPNHTLVDWFVSLVKAPQLQNQISICLISKFRPYIPLIKNLKNVISFTVDEFSKQDTQIFFLQYLRHLKQIVSPEDIKYFLPYLKGIPGQIIYAANLIESLGVAQAKKYVNDIEEFDELRALSVFEFLQHDYLSKQILIALSKFEVISNDLVYRIFGESDEVYAAIQKLFELSLFFFVSSTHEYLKLNSSISDYINRSKLVLDQQYEARIRNIGKEAIAEPIELNERSDYSMFLLNLQNMLAAHQPIPKKLLIPSFLIKIIIKEYYAWNFETVIELAQKIIDNEDRYDRQVNRETKNWLCLAYCRTQNEHFFDVINYFKDEKRDNETLKDYYFLLGFYYRNGDRMEQAEYYYLKVLELDADHSKAKRELVNVYLRTGAYDKALLWASDNYYRNRTNILHIQAYFTCLIKKWPKEDDDWETINELMDQARKSLDRKAEDITREMQAELDFYLNGDEKRAIDSLKEALRLNNRNYFAFRALYEMLKATGQYEEMEQLIKKHPRLVEPE